MTRSSAAVAETPRLNDRVVDEIKVWMVRRHLNQVGIAERIGVNQVWVSRRIGRAHDVLIDMEDLALFAAALDVPPRDLLPRLDSNQEPTGKWLPTLTLVPRPREDSSRYGSKDGPGVTNGMSDGRMDAGDRRLLRLAGGERGREGSAPPAPALPAPARGRSTLRAVVAHA
jgi:transcriptional regulator with XRE-family HTH domain